MPSSEFEKAEERIPHSIEAERAVIGWLLQDNSIIEEVFATISYNMFYDEDLRVIFKCIGELRGEGVDVDEITVKAHAMPKLNAGIREKVNNIKMVAKEKEGYDERTFNDDFFVSLLNGVVYDRNVMSYCKIIKDKYVLRRAMSIATDVIDSCRNGAKSPEQICNEAQDDYYKLGTNSGSKDYVKIGELIKPMFDEIEKASQSKNGITGIATGYKRLDELTAGFQNSDMLVLAGRPGMGKTTFALNLAYNMCSRQDKSVLFFTLEMNAIQLAKRIVSANSFVSSSSIRAGKLSDDEFRKVVDSAIDLQDKKFTIIESSPLTIADLRNKCQKVKMTEGLDIVFIDYLQLMEAGDNYRNSGKTSFMSRQEEVSVISRNIKSLAKDLNVPIVALSQLHREAETKKEPQLSDLRESGAIEQDADIVMLINRPDKEKEEEVDIILAKHRNGSTGVINLRFDKQTTRFSEWDRHTQVSFNAQQSN